MQRLICAAVASAFALGVPVVAQDLAAAAAREKERRKAAAGSKAYSEQDLGKTGGGTFSAPAGSSANQPTPAATGAPGAAAATPAGGKKEKTPDEVRAEQETAWRERLQKANDDMGKAQQRVDTLQRALNDLSQNLYGSTRSQQLQQMEEAQKAVSSLQKQVADLQDEGRKNGWR